MKSKVLLNVFLVLTLLSLFSMSAQATHITVGTIQDVIDAGVPIEVGDKVFTDFSYSATGDMPPASQVNVVLLHSPDDGPYNGLRFQAGFQDLPFDTDTLEPNFNASDALIGFTVTVNEKIAPNNLISDFHLAANADVIGLGEAVVTEFIAEVGDGVSFTAGKSNLPAGQPFNQLKNWLVLEEGDYAKSFTITKDIRMLTLPNQEVSRFPTLSQVDNTFSQVPEPAGIALLVSGLAGLGLFMATRRSRR